MMQSNTKTLRVMPLLVFLAVSVLFVALFPLGADYSNLERANYAVLLIAFLVIGGLSTFTFASKDVDILEPFTIVTVLILCVFVIYPINDVLIKDMVTHSVDVSEGCVTATLMVIVGYLAFYLGYFMQVKPGSKERTLKPSPIGAGKVQPYGKINSGMTWAYVIWLLSYAAVIVCLVSGGKSLSYLFSLGGSGEVTVNSESTSLLFLSNFAVTLVACWMYIMYEGKGWVGKLLVTLLTFHYLLLRGSRWLLLIFLAAPLVMHFVRTKRKVPIGGLIAVALVLVFVAAWMQEYRYGFKFGSGSIWDCLPDSVEDFLAPFDTEFSTYKAFYGIVLTIPSQHGFFLGMSTLVYPLVLVIPRAIWPGKPSAPANEIISIGVNDHAALSGMAYPSLGEYYADFGLVGCLVFMFAFGLILRKFVKPLRDGDEIQMLMYSLLFPLMFQWVCRGNTGGNLWLTIFGLLPLVFIRRSVLASIRAEEKRVAREAAASLAWTPVGGTRVNGVAAAAMAGGSVTTTASAAEPLAKLSHSGRVSGGGRRRTHGSA